MSFDEKKATLLSAMQSEAGAVSVLVPSVVCPGFSAIVGC